MIEQVAPCIYVHHGVHMDINTDCGSVLLNDVRADIKQGKSMAQATDDAE